MKLFKILLFIFAVYFIRRFIQFYRVMKKIQEEQRKAGTNPQATPSNNSHIVDAEYKVMDN